MYHFLLDKNILVQKDSTLNGGKSCLSSAPPLLLENFVALEPKFPFEVINVTGGRFDQTGPLVCLNPFPV